MLPNDHAGWCGRHAGREAGIHLQSHDAQHYAAVRDARGSHHYLRPPVRLLLAVVLRQATISPATHAVGLLGLTGERCEPPQLCQAFQHVRLRWHGRADAFGHPPTLRQRRGLGCTKAVHRPIIAP